MTSSERIIEYLKERFGDSLKLLVMPYKRDMWDSLEGIYTEALKRGWKADIMPLPYSYLDSERNPTGWMLDDWEGVGNIIPAHIPEKDEYDVILFHNPYDNCNRVTTIRPDLYTNNFVGLSKALCLVPYGYGIGGEIRPGTLNADIVFSENELAVLDTLRDGRRAGMNDNQIKIFSERFVVVGSTKNETDSKQPIPKQWEKKIKGRTVILFATSLVPLLENPRGELEKYDKLLEDLISRPNTVVIWREHPLTLGTIRAIIPDYEQAYVDLRVKYSDKLIIDTTNDYRIAFSVADVLYSVPSSLIALWRMTGKEGHIV